MSIDPARLQIETTEEVSKQGLTVTARCVAGVVCPGTRFQRIRDVEQRIDLVVTELWRYGSLQVEFIDPPHSARLVLIGVGGEVLRPRHLVEEIDSPEL